MIDDSSNEDYYTNLEKDKTVAKVIQVVRVRKVILMMKNHYCNTVITLLLLYTLINIHMLTQQHLCWGHFLLAKVYTTYCTLLHM